MTFANGRHATHHLTPRKYTTVPVMANEIQNSPQLLNQEEAARFLRVDIETLRRWAARGVGPRRTEFGTRFVRYRIADLDAWLDEHAVVGSSPP